MTSYTTYKYICYVIKHIIYLDSLIFETIKILYLGTDTTPIAPAMSL
jgi:hypothetical protein